MTRKISDCRIELLNAEYEKRGFIMSKLEKGKNLEYHLTWDCPTSPIGGCVYDLDSHMGYDECVYCGEPEERK